MFVFNMKIDGNRTSKIFMGILCVIILLITIFICYNLVTNSFFKTNDSTSANGKIEKKCIKVYVFRKDYTYSSNKQ